MPGSGPTRCRPVAPRREQEVARRRQQPRHHRPVDAPARQRLRAGRPDRHPQRQRERHAEVERADRRDPRHRVPERRREQRPPAPSVDTASASEPVDSVTCRTSSGSPKNAATTGDMPSRKPSATLPPRPATFSSNQRANACAPRSAERVDEARVAGDRLRQPAVGRPVLDPAGQHRGEPEQHAGERGVERRRPEERQRGHGRGRLGGRRQCATAGQQPEPLDGERRRDDDGEVADDRRHLRARQVRDLVDELGAAVRGAAPAAACAAIAAAVIAGCLVASVPCANWMTQNDSA